MNGESARTEKPVGVAVDSIRGRPRHEGIQWFVPPAACPSASPSASRPRVPSGSGATWSPMVLGRAGHRRGVRHFGAWMFASARSISGDGLRSSTGSSSVVVGKWALGVRRFHEAVTTTSSRPKPALSPSPNAEARAAAVSTLVASTVEVSATAASGVSPAASSTTGPTASPQAARPSGWHRHWRARLNV